MTHVKAASLTDAFEEQLREVLKAEKLKRDAEKFDMVLDALFDLFLTAKPQDDT